MIKGSSRDFVLQANNSDGTAATNVFQSTDTVTSRVWRGDDQPTLLSLPFLGTSTSGVTGTSWVSATAGTFQLCFNDADTSGATFEVGQYRIQTTAARGGRTAVILDCFLTIDSAPGSAASRPVYGTWQDMTKFAPWIQNLQTADDTEGFIDQRADAREWLDTIIVKNYRGSSLGQFGYHSMAAFAYGFTGPRRSLILSQWLQDQLNGNAVLSGGTYTGPPGGALLIKPPTKRIVAFRAIAEVCMGMLGKGGDYASWGVQYRRAADAECLAYTAEIDTNNDGRAEIGIPLGTGNTLYT